MDERYTTSTRKCGYLSYNHAEHSIYIYVLSCALNFEIDRIMSRIEGFLLLFWRVGAIFRTRVKDVTIVIAND